MKKFMLLLASLFLFSHFSAALAMNSNQHQQYLNKYNKLNCTVSPCPDPKNY